MLLHVLTFIGGLLVPSMKRYRVRVRDEREN